MGGVGVEGTATLTIGVTATLTTAAAGTVRVSAFGSNCPRAGTKAVTISGAVSNPGCLRTYRDCAIAARRTVSPLLRESLVVRRALQAAHRHFLSDPQ